MMKAAKGKAQVTLTLKVETHDRLLDLAKAEDRTLAGYIRWILNDYLRKLDEEAKTQIKSGGTILPGCRSA